MQSYEEFFELMFGYVKRFAFSEDLLAIDIAMSKQELFTLMTMDRLKDATMSQLSESMNFPMSTATGIIDRLVKKGYVQRDKSESDRRIVVVSLTEKGSQLAGTMKTTILSYIKKAYDVLDNGERETLFRIIEKITASFRQMGDEMEAEKKEKSQLRKIEIE
jgi:Transcriptional regulators